MMSNLVSLVVLYVILSVPLKILAQDANSVNSAPPGISADEVSAQLEVPRTELHTAFSARADSFKLLHKSACA